MRIVKWSLRSSTFDFSALGPTSAAQNKVVCRLLRCNAPASTPGLPVVLVSVSIATDASGAALGLAHPLLFADTSRPGPEIQSKSVSNDVAKRLD